VKNKNYFSIVDCRANINSTEIGEYETWFKLTYYNENNTRVENAQNADGTWNVLWADNTNETKYITWYIVAPTVMGAGGKSVSRAELKEVQDAILDLQRAVLDIYGGYSGIIE